MDRPEIILAPGPTPIPPQVLLAQGSPLVYHRGPGFGAIMREVTDRLKELYRTESADVLLMTSSGTGGLESAIQNCFSAGDEVFVPLAGFFSERFQRLAEAYGLVVRTIEYEWGTRIRPADVAAALEEHPVKAVLLTHSETSTGVIQPIRELAEVARAAMARHRMLSRAVKEGAKALGLDLFGEGLEQNWTVTAIRAPECADADTICDTIRADHGCVLAPGQGPLKGSVFRIGHFGYFSELDIVRGLAALEMTLEKLGHPVKRGAGVAAAETVFMEHR